MSLSSVKATIGRCARTTLVSVTLGSILMGASCQEKPAPAPRTFIPVDCEPYPYPRPLILQPLKKDIDFRIYKDYVNITSAGWSKVISWQHDAEAFSLNVMGLQKYVEDCVADYNEEQEGK